MLKKRSGRRNVCHCVQIKQGESYKKNRSESSIRISTGIVITVLISAVLLLSHIPAVLYSAVILLNVLSVYEVFRAAFMHRSTKLLWSVILCAAALTVIPFSHYEIGLNYIFLLAVLFFFRIMRRCNRFILDVPVRLCSICLLIVLLFRSIPEIRRMEHGFYVLILAVLSSCATDIFAYLTGKKLGKRKLCPKISPNKTIEGSIGGIVGTVGVLILFGLLLDKAGVLQVNYPMLLLYAVASSIVGQFGDLSMSAVKRCLGVKDFGTVFPGHGGILDRYDSLLFIAPFTCRFCRYVSIFYF